MSDFNLAAVARTLLADATHADPTALATDLVANIPAEHLQEALLTMARSYMRVLITQQRASVNGGSPSQATGSKKVAAVREAWRRLLNTPEYVPSVGWVFLRDATHAQVLEMATERRKKSRELASAADRYCALADAMQRHSVMRVADLADDTLEHLLEQAA